MTINIHCFEKIISTDNDWIRLAESARIALNNFHRAADGCKVTAVVFVEFHMCSNNQTLVGKQFQIN